MQNITHLRPVIPMELFNDTRVSPNAFKVYVYINELAFNGCTYSNEQLAEVLGITIRNVRKHITLLVELGYLKREIENNNERTLIVNIQSPKAKHKTPQNDFMKFVNQLREFVMNNCSLTFDGYTLKKDNYQNIRIFNNRTKRFLNSEQSKIVWRELFKNRHTVNENIKKLKGGTQT